MATHKCPALNCGKQVAPERLACRGHWYAIPHHLRSRLWDAYLGRSTEDHGEVMAECVAHLRDRYPA